MKIKQATCCFIFCLCFLAVRAYCIEIKPFGNLFFRAGPYSAFEPLKGNNQFSDDTILTVLPELKLPLATDSGFIIGSCTVILFPGTVLKISDQTFVPLQGRINLKSEHELGSELLLRGQKFLCGFKQGDLLVEVTPAQTAWLLLLRKGSVWLKDFSRKVIVLEPLTEIEIPRFGKTIIRQRPSSRWSLGPENAVVRNVETVFNPASGEKENASETEEIASDSQEIASDTENLQL